MAVNKREIPEIDWPLSGNVFPTPVFQLQELIESGHFLNDFKSLRRILRVIVTVSLIVISVFPYLASFREKFVNPVEEFTRHFDFRFNIPRPWIFVKPADPVEIERVAVQDYQVRPDLPDVVHGRLDRLLIVIREVNVS